MTTGGDARQFGYVAAAVGDLDDSGAGTSAEDDPASSRDSDGTPVGEADRQADIERSKIERSKSDKHHHRHDV